MEQTKKWGFWLLTAFVVGNMVGSGIFMLPSTLRPARQSFRCDDGMACHRRRCADDCACIWAFVHS
ncbi:hypothetical protein BSAF29S_00364 [Bacillus safensis subsp. safensis]